VAALREIMTIRVDRPAAAVVVLTGMVVPVGSIRRRLAMAAPAGRLQSLERSLAMRPVAGEEPRIVKVVSSLARVAR
jgi:hypothetical protein